MLDTLLDLPYFNRYVQTGKKISKSAKLQAFFDQQALISFHLTDESGQLLVADPTEPGKNRIYLVTYLACRS